MKQISKKTGDKSMSEFLRRAAILGHSAEDLERHGVIQTTLIFNTLQEYASFMQDLHQHDKECLRNEFASSPLTLGHPTTQMNRIHRFVLADTPLEAGDQEALHNPHLPLHVNAVSATTKTLPAGETKIGPSWPATVWNFDTINIPSNAYITVQSTPFSLTTTNLVMQYTPPT